MSPRETLPPFDAVAASYDSTFSETAVGKAQRERVWHFLARALSRRVVSNILECSCGTGVDARWLGRQGYRVLATDVSPQMVAATRHKVENAPGVEIETAVCAMQAISADPIVQAAAPFDLIWSNFGGINCLSPAEIRQFHSATQTVLKPGGLLGLVVMSRFSGWETLYFLLKGKPAAAFRRWSKKALQARLDEKTTVATWYYSPAELAKLLPDYRVKAVFPIGFWLPPSYLDPFFKSKPGLLALLHKLEKKSAAGFLAPAADHYFLLLERKNSDLKDL